MSIVLAVATSEVAILKCDGRALSHDGKIINEHKQKYSIIGKQCAIGYTGSVNLIEAVIDKALIIFKEYGYMYDTLTVTDCSKIFQKILVESKKNIKETESLTANFVFVGLEGKKIVVKSLGSGSNFEICDVTPTSANSFKYCSLTSYAAENAIQFNNFYEKEKSLIDNMDNYIKYISTIDDSVNTNIFTTVLKRENDVSNTN